MKQLIDIARILTKKKIAKIEILDENMLKNSEGLFSRFYEGLITERIKTDETAVALLYGEADVNETKYRKLKSRFRRRLLNTLFFLNVNAPLASNHERAHFTCNKEWALVEIMMAYQARKAAMIQARQILTIALKFHLTDMIVRSARLLREDAALREDESAFGKYHAHVQHYTSVLAAETQAEELYQQAYFAYVRTHFKKKHADELRDRLDQSIRLSQSVATPVIEAYVFRVWVLNLKMVRDYEELLRVTRQGVAHLQRHADYFSEREKHFFYNQEMLVYLHLHQIQAGNNLISNILTKYYEQGSEAWFDLQEYQMLLLLHTENFTQAMGLFRRLASTPAFNRLEDVRQEKWELIEFFLNYLVQKGVLSAELLPPQRKMFFEEGEFVVTNLAYPSNHATVTLHRITFQMLFRLIRGSHPRVPGKMEQLRQLLSYELKKGGHKRALVFARLLHLLYKFDFKTGQSKRFATYERNLRTTPFFYRGKISEFEAIPYEKLWELVCECL